jgi:AraC-like DNA-binding protein
MTSSQILWVDLLAGPRTTEIPEVMRDHFSVRVVRNSDYLTQEVAAPNVLAIIYDCDYTDRNRLLLIRSVREANLSVPFVLLTLQHSESLAVWAFRQGALDYLVKPLGRQELEDCRRRLERIAEFKRSPQQRRTQSAVAELPKSVSRSTRIAGDRLAPAVFYVQKNYSQRIYSDALARLCGLSPTYFSKAFRQRFNMSFQEFLLRYRIANACALLSNPRACISDVAYSAGFTDPSYFTRMFRRYVGVSPSEYVAPGCGKRVDEDFLLRLDGPSASSSQVVRALACEFGGDKGAAVSQL